MNQATSYDAISARRFWTGFERGEGVGSYGSFRVSQRGAGVNMSVDVNMDDGAYVRGDAVTLQGLYYVAPHSTATINETIAAADATNPRIDRIILEIKDNAHDASGSSLAQTRVVTGTATVGATLDNLTGAAAVPVSSLLLADVLVGATVTSISDANIRDRRAFQPRVTPPLVTKVDMVEFMPPVYAVPVLGAVPADTLSVQSSTTGLQAAALMWLPRRIASATRIRWAYQVTSNIAVNGNYVVAVFDASGRKIIDTGSVAFAGALNTWQSRSDTITATTFEPGAYYVFFGTTGISQGGVYFQGVAAGHVSNGRWGGHQPNTVLTAASGGVTVPTTLSGLSDLNANTTTLSPSIQVPLVALSVG